MGGALVLLGGLMVGRALPGGLGARQSDAAAEVQDLVNRLGALSGAAGVYLVPRLPVPAPMGSGSSSALPGGLVLVAGVGTAAHSDLESSFFCGGRLLLVGWVCALRIGVAGGLIGVVLLRRALWGSVACGFVGGFVGWVSSSVGPCGCG